jgi:catechol 2,3-dioxygenase-like lactoylglutathione lyase family enzyme
MPRPVYGFFRSADEETAMITGIHVMMYSPKADAVRAFMRDVLEFPHVDAGEDWLIFKAPAAEMASHPIEGQGHWDVSLMCDDLEATLKALAAKGVGASAPRDLGWGVASTLNLPDGSGLMIYQPRYQTAI